MVLCTLGHAPLHAQILPMWTRVATIGPSGRLLHAMAYDSHRGVTVLFGGTTGLGHLGDTWEWNGASWAQVASTGPPGRVAHSMVYDSQRQKTVMFGGDGGSGALGDTWEWNGRKWLQVASTGPSAGGLRAMAYDSQRGKTVLFGGGTWEWDGALWVQVATSGPAPRKMHTMAYDSQRGRTVLFGGDGNPVIGSPYRGDTWEWDGIIWSQVASTGPSARALHAMAYDSRRGRTVLFGGEASGGSHPTDTWEWDGTSWTSMATTGHAGGWGPVMAFDKRRGKTVLFGGVNQPETWEWFDLVPPAAYTPFGSGCLGPNGLVPSLAGVPGEVPRAGTTSHVRVTNLPATATIAVFVIGLSNSWDPDGYALPIDLGVVGWPGCPQLVADQGISYAITTTGEADQGISVPAGYPPWFAFYVQALVLYQNPPNPPYAAAVSNAVAGIVGY